MIVLCSMIVHSSESGVHLRAQLNLAFVSHADHHQPALHLCNVVVAVRIFVTRRLQVEHDVWVLQRQCKLVHVPSYFRHALPRGTLEQRPLMVLHHYERLLPCILSEDQVDAYRRFIYVQVRHSLMPSSRRAVLVISFDYSLQMPSREGPSFNFLASCLQIFQFLAFCISLRISSLCSYRHPDSLTRAPNWPYFSAKKVLPISIF